MELTSDVADFKGNQDVDPNEADPPIIIQEAYFMAKEPGKEFIAIDQMRKMKYFSAMGKTVFQMICQVLKQNLQTPFAEPER